MIIEIGYSYQSDKQSPAYNSWTYFYVKGEDFEKNKKKAETYWKRFVSELGWQKKAKLIHIEEICNGKNYKPQHIIVDSAELAPARKRKSPSVPSSTRTRSTKRKSPSTRTSPPRKSQTRTRTQTRKKAS